MTLLRPIPVTRWEQWANDVVPLLNHDGAVRPGLWVPQPGSQDLFLRCDDVEVAYIGSRGPGKTDALLMDYAQFVGRGFGPAWRGVVLRQSFADLDDIISKTKVWFPRIHPGCEYNKNDHSWQFKDGEFLKLAFLETPDEFETKFQGQQFPWIGFEELGSWPNDKPYKQMLSLNRSTVPGMPRHVRATANPGGRGHNWIKQRWQLPLLPGRVFGPLVEGQRRAVHGLWAENRILMITDPNYVKMLEESILTESQRKAWIEGSWDITAGGALDDLWPDVSKHCIVDVDVPRLVMAGGGSFQCAFDYGQSHPSSCGWYWRSDGSDLPLCGGKQRSTRVGDLVRFAEFYTTTGRANEGLRLTAMEIAKNIIARETALGLRGRVRGRVADSSIFDKTDGPTNSIAGEFEKAGLRFEPSDKSPGSRQQGLAAVRRWLFNTMPKDGYREHRGLFIGSSCPHWLRTVPVLPFSKKQPDDVDSEAEDHCYDETRYLLRADMWAPPLGGRRRVGGP